MRRGQCFARAAERGEIDRVHAENFPRHVADGEIHVVQRTHAQFPRALAQPVENLRQKRGERVGVQIRRHLAGHSQTVLQRHERARHARQFHGVGDDVLWHGPTAGEIGWGRARMFIFILLHLWRIAVVTPNVIIRVGWLNVRRLGHVTSSFRLRRSHLRLQHTGFRLRLRLRKTEKQIRDFGGEGDFPL